MFACCCRSDESMGELAEVQAVSLMTEPPAKAPSHAVAELREDSEMETVVVPEVEGVSTGKACPLKQDQGPPPRPEDQGPPLSPPKPEDPLRSEELELPMRVTFQIARTDPPGDLLGAAWDTSDGVGLLLDAVGSGALASWNEAHAEQAITPGDRVVAINDAKGDPSLLLSRLMADKELRVVVIKPKTVRLSFTRDDGPFGLDLEFDAKAKTIVLRRLTDGCVRKWCEENGQDIGPGDRVLDVNGTSGNAAALREKLSQVKSGQTVSMIILHYSSSDCILQV